MTDNKYDEDFRRLYEVIGRLEQAHPDDNLVTELGVDADILKENYQLDYEAKRCLNAFQKINDKLFAKYGMSDDILDFQVLINKLRSKLDEPDPKEVVVHADDGDFVQ